MSTFVYCPSLVPDTLTPCLLNCQQRHPGQTLLLLVPDHERTHVAELQALCRELGMDCVGAIFPMLVKDAAFIDSGCWLIPLPSGTRWQLTTFNTDQPVQIAAQLIDALQPALEHSSPIPPTLMLLFDGLIPCIASVLDHLFQHFADSVRYLGANAGSETFLPLPCLFDSSQFVRDAVLCLVLPQPLDYALRHDYCVPERVMTATSSRGNKVEQINWQNAFSAYQDIVRQQHGMQITRDNFYSLGVHFPFGISRLNGDVLIRIPVELTEDGALLCVGEVPENSLLMLLQAPQVPGDSAAQLITQLDAPPGDGQGLPLLLFYCAGRRLHFQEHATTELARLTDKAGPRALAGALSLGEIGSPTDGGYPVFQNACLLGIAWRG
ncbi:FIST N-terminal domain-containing protein [Pokkaliibacter sp. MBI-7]|uniref:FIST signal transduction protein n=1 Tax=Pokkaliibacter sp. MBI-7 TaxID=3040600 RepID=UPI00244CE287|nr:FIST C-terminal domain-containing protein [Pokkaliibacter sp. MBI-7]MDH2436203.1 FIST N-terminal domain-containing protein [Pokkaliibacter sp. MBI-7]